jgi:site-specific DNA-methyltransferase (cytosine-N4-specific)
MLEAGSVQTIVTSPPYFGLRDYGETGQMGAEETLAGYVEGMVSLFRELHRVLADDGTLWLNLGDSYAGSWGNQGRKSERGTQRPIKGGMLTPVHDGRYPTKGSNTGAIRDGEPAAKNLIGVPWRIALALQADGWILRSDIIWHKPNPMPESVTDRPTKAHEYLFLLAKSPKYFYDASAISEVAAKGSAGSTFTEGKTGTNGLGRTSTVPRIESERRNKRSVWSVPTAPFSEAHFAVYPPELIRPCILGGSRPGDTVLDPFSGSGTTGMVATQEGRKYIGIDLNRDYLDLSLSTRFAQPTLNFGGEL